MIHFHEVCKTYRSDRRHPVLAVQGLNLQVQRGEIFGCIGPNGAGKSTTIKLLLDLARPDQGQIEIDGVPTSDQASRSRVGYLPENPYLYEFLTGREYLAYAGRLSGLANKLIRERGEALLAKLKLSEAADRRISSYSKGMQQRTAIAAALIHDPALVVLDEPMSGLDPLGRRLIFDLIAELRGEGKTVFISSHVLSDIERLCDRIGIIVRGRLSHLGSVADMSVPLEELFEQVVYSVGVDEVK